MKKSLAILAALATALVLASCDSDRGTDEKKDGTKEGDGGPKPYEVGDIGLATPFKAEVVAGGLENPTTIAFHPSSGEMFVAESAAGRVVSVSPAAVEPFATGFATEYWKNLPDGRKFFHVGPLGLAFLADGTLAVGTGGNLKYGQDVLAFFKGAGAFEAAEKSNALPRTSESVDDAGEGNFVGLAVSPDGKTIHVASHGYDKKTWVLACDVATRKLDPWLSFDDLGIAANSPMACLWRGENRLLVLLSGGTGSGGDSLAVELDVAAKTVVRQWTFPGLEDVYGIAPVPGTANGFVVCDYSFKEWEVAPGKLAHVLLPDEGGAATVHVIADKMKGPVFVTFKPGTKDLYVAELGEHFDAKEGRILKIAGF